MKQILYASLAAAELGLDDLENILATARRRNKKDDITGLLLFGGGRFFQVIEGPTLSIDRLYSDIK
ncbi:MAG: BLUF domain-containing protein, partial [Pseudomonadota bacterium]